jgi:azurin
MDSMMPTMNFLRIGCGLLCGLVTVSRAEPPEWSATPDAVVSLKTTEGTMRYNLAEFTVEPGARVKLHLENEDGLQHNVVLLKAEGSAAAGLAFAQEIWAGGEAALARGWMPSDSAKVLAASRLLDPKGTEDLYFVAPRKAADYPFVCTVPGHATIMNGIMKVRQSKPAFKDLQYRLYEGEWTALPDFASLTPVISGPVPGGLITLDVIGKRKPDKFALVFEGTFEVAEDDEYEFFLGSDDGSRLILDGEGELEANGIHPFKTVSKKLPLTKGLHSLQVHYFEAMGGEGLALAAKRKKGGLLNFSRDNPDSFGKRTPPPPVIALRPVREGEAVIYRNFIEGSSPRGIAVGYPGGVNICWDADVCNVALLWRGAFMDAGRHWTGRGVGAQPPMGFDVASAAKGYPLQILTNPEETWKEFSIGTIKSEKDVPDPQKEISLKLPNPDYQFRGYRLDAKRFPEFRYRFRKLEVTDRFEPELFSGGAQGLRRVITFKGETEPRTMQRVAIVQGEPDAEGYYPAGPIAVRVVGGAVQLRPGQGGRELLVAVTAPQELEVHYRWFSVMGGKTPAAP